MADLFRRAILNRVIQRSTTTPTITGGGGGGIAQAPTPVSAPRRFPRPSLPPPAPREAPPPRTSPVAAISFPPPVRRDPRPIEVRGGAVAPPSTIPPVGVPPAGMLTPGEREFAGLKVPDDFPTSPPFIGGRRGKSLEDIFGPQPTTGLEFPGFGKKILTTEPLFEPDFHTAFIKAAGQENSATLGIFTDEVHKAQIAEFNRQKQAGLIDPNAVFNIDEANLRLSYDEFQALVNAGQLKNVTIRDEDGNLAEVPPPFYEDPRSNLSTFMARSDFKPSIELPSGNTMEEIDLVEYSLLISSDPTQVFPAPHQFVDEDGKTRYYVEIDPDNEFAVSTQATTGTTTGGAFAPKPKGTGGGGVAVPEIPTTGEWTVTYSVDDAPVWWLGKTSSNTTDPNDQLAAELNATIPFLSPEDQEFMAGLIFQVFPNAFPEYSDIAFGPPPSEITTELRDIFTSATRGRAFAEALNRLAGALNLGEADLGPGFIFLRQLADILAQFGGGPPGQGQRQTREMFVQQQEALENLINAAQGNPALKNLIDAARRISEPGFSAGPVVPLSRDAQGNLVFGAPNPELF